MDFIDNMAQASDDDDDEELLHEQYESDIVDDTEYDSNFLDYYKFDQNFFEKQSKNSESYKKQNKRHLQQQQRAIDIMKYESQHRAPYPSQSPPTTQDMQKEEEVEKFKNVINTVKIPEKWRSIKAKRRASVRSRKPCLKKTKIETYHKGKKKKSLSKMLMKKKKIQSNVQKKIHHTFMKRSDSVTYDESYSDSYGGYSFKKQPLIDPLEKEENGAVVSTFNMV